MMDKKGIFSTEISLKVGGIINISPGIKDLKYSVWGITPI